MCLKLAVFFLYVAFLMPGEGAGRTFHRPEPTSPAAIGKVRSTPELLRLIKNLRNQGARVVLTREKVSQPFFSVPARIVNVNGQGLQVSEYTQAAGADKEAGLVSSNGMTIGTSKPSWLSTPHFFKRKRLIVLYIGDDQTILRILQTTLGGQFAGG